MSALDGAYRAAAVALTVTNGNILHDARGCVGAFLAHLAEHPPAAVAEAMDTRARDAEADWEDIFAAALKSLIDSAPRYYGRERA